ncbi:MAG: acyltransferase family protein [Bacteroidales bacterium]|nr:acyltransferase family protein [Bacteroidales bacterium]
MNKNATSELICFVRFPLAIGVVMGHCFFRIKGWQYDKLSEQGLGSNVAMEFLLSTRILLLSVVALFFLLSGYLFFKHLEQWDSNVWLRKMKRRLWTLLIPYILWNTIYIF